MSSNLPKFFAIACLLVFTLGANHAQAATSCLVMGDSIAVGIGSNLPQCVTDAKVGLNTTQALARFPKPSADRVIVSLGINDGVTGTEKHLNEIRSRIQAHQVIWILPSHLDKKSIVSTVAKEHGDRTINIDSLISTDGIHPTTTGYRKIAQQLNQLQGDKL